VGQLSLIFDRLKTEGKDGSYAAFVFQPPGRPRDDDSVNIEFSVEGGRIGLDWCLIAPANIRDQEKYEQFVTSLGYQFRSCEMNQVKFLRIDEGNLPQLCEKVVCDLYHSRRDTRLDLVVEGFTWP
jgi:hypothetical protein